jgi:uridine phosphorylase
MNKRPRHDEADPRSPAGPFTASDLPIDEQGRIYHLQLKPEQLAPDILLVGDPGRVELIASVFLRDLELQHEHRGLVTVTGTAEVSGERATIIAPLKTTVTTSGMGAPSLEIVANELAALNEIDFSTRTRKPAFPGLHVLRVGTSGALQAATKLGTPIVTSYAVGMDNSGLFYELPWPDETCARLERELDRELGSITDKASRFHKKIHPYVARAEPAMVKALLEAAAALGVPARLGLTVSASGFFAAQGRDIGRARPVVPDLDRFFADYDPGLDGQRVENMEMEAAFLLYFLGGLGYRAGAICPAIANRRENSFDPLYREAVENATRVGLLALADLRGRCPDARLEPRRTSRQRRLSGETTPRRRI